MSDAILMMDNLKRIELAAEVRGHYVPVLGRLNAASAGPYSYPTIALLICIPILPFWVVTADLILVDAFAGTKQSVVVTLPNVKYSFAESARFVNPLSSLRARFAASICVLASAIEYFAAPEAAPGIHWPVVQEHSTSDYLHAVKHTA